MRHAIVAAALAGLALAATASEPAAAVKDPSADVTRSYALRATAEPAVLKLGASGKVRLVIEPTGAVHVDPKAPIKVTLSTTPGLTLPKGLLGRQDAVPAGPGVAFEAPFTAASAGKQEVKAKLDFFLCTDQWCVKQVRDVTVAVAVQ